jgi:queuine/archaeosine tRNA-ribosyltransferase
MTFVCLPLAGGRPPFLSQQLLEALDAEFAQVGEVRFSLAAGALHGRAGGGGQLEEALRARGIEVRDYLWLGAGRHLVATLHDGVLPPPDWSCAKGESLVAVSAGQELQHVSLAQFLRIAGGVVKADSVIAPYETVSSAYSAKNADRALARTAAWSKQTLEHIASSDEWGATVLLPVVGHTKELALRCARNIAALLAGGAPAGRPAAARPPLGLCFCNLLFAPAEERPALVRAALGELEPILPGLASRSLAVMGASGPGDLIDMWALGIGALESTLPYTLTKCGMALACAAAETRLVQVQGRGQEKEQAQAQAPEPEPLAINLRDPAWARDKRPLALGCACWACKTHVRGYVSHLVLSKEMLGEMLLFTHNAHQVLELARYVRSVPADQRVALAATWRRRHGQAR